MIGSLFSGVGGLELGLEWAGLGPTADVRDAGSATLPPVSLICGGFPCQDISSAGTRRGLEGSRSGLWYEFARVLEELRPRFAVVENVASGSRKWVDAVRADLGRLGYASLPVPLEARDVGAPHLRARVFIVAANPNGVLVRQQPGRSSWQGGEGAGELVLPGFEGEDLAHGDSVRQPSEQASRLRHRDVPYGYHTDRCGVHAFPPGRGDVAGWEEYVRNGGAEPGLRRGSNGSAPGVDSARLKALGNGVVPQLSEVVGYIIQQLLVEEP